MTLSDKLRVYAELLRESGCPDPEVDARWLAEDLLALSSAQLRFHDERDVPSEKLKLLDAAIERRRKGEPVQYILNRADFMGLRFYVDERVLIPRQDTETLVENAVIALRGSNDPTVLDLCTGSGAIGLSVKTLVPEAEVTLTDLSRDALEVAKKNAHLLDAEVTFRHGDLFRAVGHARYDMILSNPPYIPTAELGELQREVRREPVMALDGGADGLDIYRRILADAPAHLNAGGSVYLEVGIGEAADVLALAHRHIDSIGSGIIRDINGIDRIVWIRSR